MPKKIPFKESELIGSLREAAAHARGQLNLKTTQVAKKAATLSPKKIRQIRATLKASTPVFAAYLNVSPDAVRSWENNRRQPSGPALRLLEIAAKRPEVLVG
jgi:putative transcriptional regulator